MLDIRKKEMSREVAAEDASSRFPTRRRSNASSNPLEIAKLLTEDLFELGIAQSLQCATRAVYHAAIFALRPDLHGRDASHEGCALLKG